MTVFVSDTFTDTNNVLLQDHTPETGGAWSLRRGENVEILNNKASSLATYNYATYTNAAAPGGAEYDITCVFDRVQASNSWGLIARLMDISNYYLGMYAEWAGDYRVMKRVAGVWTLLDNTVEAWVGSKTLKFEIKDSAKKLYADAAEKGTTADNTMADAGSVGVYSYHQATTGDVTWDTFIAAGTGTAESEYASMQPIHHWWPR